MCTSHASENKELGEQFKNSLDPQSIPTSPTGKFFLTMPMTFFQQDVQTFTTEIKNENGYEILPDIAGPALYMLHSINIGQKSCMLFYDSGCLNATVSSTAHAMLDTLTVRPGPTQMRRRVIIQ